jgi:hypothetical protein
LISSRRAWRTFFAANTPLPQSGAITLGDAENSVTIVVESRLDGDKECVILTLADQQAAE